MNRKIWKRNLLLGALGIITLLVLPPLVSELRKQVARRSLLSQSEIRQAYEGVRRNEDWEPRLHRLNNLDWVLVPAGCFTMGSSDAQLDEARDSCNRFYGSGNCQYDFPAAEQPGHSVCFEKPYWMGVAEITNREYGSSSSTNNVTMYRGPDWPRETVVTVTFAEHAGQTTLTLHQTVRESLAKRTGAHPSWIEMFDRLAAELAGV